MSLVATLLGLVLQAHASGSCAELHSPSSELKVVWISPVPQRVTGGARLQVVALEDLEAWSERAGASPTRLLQGMGLVNRRARGRRARRPYKATVFEVRREWLCRPIAIAEAGTSQAGVPVCAEAPSRRLGRGPSTCGYTVDALGQARGLDVYRIRWRDAASGGFCVYSLDKLLASE